MSLRDYEGWRRYAKWKRENRDAWERSIKKQEQMSDREIMNAKRGRNSSPKVKNVDQMPDQKWHRRISFLKSGIRIIGYLAIPVNIAAAVSLLVVSEVVGIIEELV